MLEDSEFYVFFLIKAFSCDAEVWIMMVEFVKDGNNKNNRVGVAGGVFYMYSDMRSRSVDERKENKEKTMAIVLPRLKGDSMAQLGEGMGDGGFFYFFVIVKDRRGV